MRPFLEGIRPSISIQITEILLRRIDCERWTAVRENAVARGGKDEARIRIKMYPGKRIRMSTIECNCSTVPGIDRYI